MNKLTQFRQELIFGNRIKALLCLLRSEHDRYSVRAMLLPDSKLRHSVGLLADLCQQQVTEINYRVVASAGWYLFRDPKSNGCKTEVLHVLESDQLKDPSKCMCYIARCCDESVSNIHERYEEVLSLPGLSAQWVNLLESLLNECGNAFKLVKTVARPPRVL